MTKNRLEAISDGILAIIITVMVLEFEVPKDTKIESFMGLLPNFVAYLFSYLAIATIWINHHNLMHKVNSISNQVLWANFNLMFWLSFFPFATAYIGNSDYQTLPVFFYTLLLLIAEISWLIFVYFIMRVHNNNMVFRKLIFQNKVSFISMCITLCSLLVSFNFPIASVVLNSLIIISWIIPRERKIS